MTASAVKVRGMSHAQGTFRLDTVDFELPTGLVMGFVGPNGSGKTTTIKALLGMFQPNSGSVELFGAEAPGAASTKERIGVVLDQPFVSPDWKVGSLTYRVGNFFASWDPAAFGAYLERFRISTSARVGTLSRGEGVKLSLAMALAHHPELLILDEPTSGLDPVSRADLVDILREFMIDPAHSILFSTHITSDLESLADLILVIDNGQIAFSGTVDALHEEFAMVHGTETLTAEALGSVLGLRHTGNRFDGLIRAEATPLFGPSTVIDAASTDDVIVHIARNGSTQQEVHS
ncbi:ABC transporter ATP-binding protein [Glaciihabitans sp. INWT7]|uniref:ABC transporter ATP-binding protein n=1 Tax=Glaciihabitans sp. INWT7 TaxID=2596912 RepID=UPI0016296D06|nr:ABC transporter ATP-binding protein [Glaciihabitans sp. INWT7]